MATYGTAVDPDIINEAGKRAEEFLLEMFTQLWPKNISPSGLTYGSVPMDRGDRIAAFLWRVQTGALDLLQTYSEPQFKAYVEEFLDDVEKSPVYSQSPHIVQLRAELQRRIGVLA